MEISPVTEQIKKDLEENAVSIAEDKNFLNIGAVVVRGTTEINKANLNPMLDELGQGIKQKFPQIYNSLFKGDDNQLQVDKYSYQKDLIENAQFFNPE